MYEKIICANCGKVEDNDTDFAYVTINGEETHLCPECAEAEGFVMCEDCGDWIEASDAHDTPDGPVCEGCFDDDYAVCEDCGEVLRQGDACYAYDVRYGCELLVCQDCLDDNYTFCTDCERYVRDNRIVYSDNYNSICSECSEDWCKCADCGTVLRQYDAYWHEGDECWYCGDCYREDSNLVHDYSYKPVADFKYRPSENKPETVADVETFGLELEVDRGEDLGSLAEELTALDQPIYLKRDGSLDCGLEIVTHPCSLAYHQYELRWAEITRLCKSHGFESHDAGTCGLHIHVGRAPLGDTFAAQDIAAGNIALLVNRVWDSLLVFSRRDSYAASRWAKRMPRLEVLSAEGLYTDAELTDRALSTYYDGRYQAVNLSNTHTVELRIFRGTLKRNTIIASLQFTSNLVKYAMTHTPTECNRATFADVLAVQSYKELDAYCRERGLA